MRKSLTFSSCVQEVPRLVLVLVIDSIGALGIDRGWRLASTLTRAVSLIFEECEKKLCNGTDVRDSTKYGPGYRQYVHQHLPKPFQKRRK